MPISRRELEDVLHRLGDVSGHATSLVSIAVRAGGSVELMRRRMSKEEAQAACIRSRV